jgi:hypothetical protein
MSPNSQTQDAQHNTQYYDTIQTAAYFKLDEETLMAYVHQLSLSPKLDEQTGLLMLAHRDIELLRRAIPAQTPKKNQDSLASATGVRRFGTAPTPKRETFVPRQPETQSQTAVQEPALQQSEMYQPEMYQPEMYQEEASSSEQDLSTRAMYEAQYSEFAASNTGSSSGDVSGPIPDYTHLQSTAQATSDAIAHAKQAIAPVAAKPSPLPRPAASINPAHGNGLEKKDNLAMIVEAVSHAKEGILKDLSRLLDDKLAGLDEVVVELIRCKSENDTLKEKLKAALDEKESLRHELSKFKPVQFGFYRKVN